MKKHFVPMKLQKDTDPIPLDIGQTIMVHLEGEIEDMVVPMTVLKVYDNGDFDGEVVWGET
jgi:hypothetical protein